MTSFRTLPTHAVRLVPLLLASLAVGASPLATSAVTSPSAAARADVHEEFLTEFKKIMPIKAWDEGAKLIKANPDVAVLRIVFTCEQIATQNSEELETLIDALRKSWERAYGTAFVDGQYRYFSFLDAAFKRERKNLKTKYDQFIARFEKAVQEKNQVELELLAGQLEGLAKSFETIGDRFYAAQSWYMYGNCNDERHRGNKADLKKVAESYGKAIEHHEAMGLVGRTTDELKQRYKLLVAEGWVEGGEPPPTPTGATPAEPGAPQPAAAPVPAGPITAAMTFDLVDDIEEFQRPGFTTDDVYQVWTGLNFARKGSSAKFNTMEDSPTLYRVGSSDIRVDAAGDGSAEDDEKIPITGNFEPVQLKLGKGPEERPWAFLCVIGLQQDMFQGIQMNLMFTDDTFQLYTVPAGSMVGRIGETEVRVLDDNMDGVYGSKPTQWAYVGLSEGVYQPEMDSLVIGSADRAVPWSEYVQVAGQWYKLETLKGGNELVATPTKVRTGTLKLDFDGPKPEWLIVQGSNTYENCYYDLVGQKTVEVPIGRYSLYYGEIKKGKKRQTSKCLILPGASSSNWSVTEGETTTVELGKPFSFDFKFRREGQELTVIGGTVVVTGKNQERYERNWNAVPRPAVSWRKAGSRRGSKAEDMDIVLDNDGINKHGWGAAWMPLDTTVKMNVGSDDAIEVQLVEKKNALFGKIESDWKGEK